MSSLPLPPIWLLSTGAAEDGTWRLTTQGRQIFYYYWWRHEVLYMNTPPLHGELIPYPHSEDEWEKWAERFETSERTIEYEARHSDRYLVSSASHRSGCMVRMESLMLA